jgi:hypothetical protein
VRQDGLERYHEPQLATSYGGRTAKSFRAVREATIVIVFALALMLSLVDANQQAAATTSAEHSKHPFEPKDVLINSAARRS